MSGKGFGKKKSPVVDKIVEVESSTLKIPESSAEISQQIENNDREMIGKGVESLDEVVTRSKSALKSKMFEARKDDIAQKIKELQEEEALIASDPSVGAVPEIVANRMIARMAGFFGVPVFGGTELLPYSTRSTNIFGICRARYICCRLLRI